MLRLKELYAGGPLDVACHIVTTVLVGALYWPLIDHRLLIVWLAISALIIAHRVFFLRDYQLTGGSSQDESWLKRYEISALCSGCAWGAVFSYSAIVLAPQHLPAFTLILGTLVAVPMATYFSQCSIYIRFSTPAMLIPIIVLTATLEPMKFVLALLTLGWYVVTNQNAKQLTDQRDNLAHFRRHKHQQVLSDITELTSLDERALAEIQRVREDIAKLRGDTEFKGRAPCGRSGD